MAQSAADTQVDHKVNLVLLGLLTGMLIWSGIMPHDRLTWVLEIAPVIIGLAVFTATYKRYRYTRLSYLVMFLAGVLICIGGHYT
ncbi:MAG TPA: hypothetical protein VNT79_05525 [Phycisphaerae bacterium]|nr:hypothetical protein [Phycisphaerae bacterium]